MDLREVQQRIVAEIGNPQLAIWIIEEAKVRDKGTNWENLAYSMACRFKRGEPIQYIFGHWSFRSLDLRCDSRALIPRPETEQLVQLIIDELGSSASKDTCILEIGTGTGAIAVSLAKEVENLTIVASDISSGALELAAENLARQSILRSEVHLIQSDLYGAIALEPHFDLIVSNPPYVPTGSYLESRVFKYEPHLALFGGLDGLDFIEPIIAGAPQRLKGRGGRVFLEIDQGHGENVLEIANECGFTQANLIKDYPGKDRFVSLVY